MLSSISPLGERARGNRFWRTAAAYAVGSLVGGAAVGSAFGALGQAVGVPAGHPAAYLGLGAVAVVGVVLDVRGALPTPRRQVDERWLSTYRGWVYGAGFGFQLGLGVATIVTASTTYVAFAAAALSGSWVGGAVIGTTFGAARAVPLAVTARVRTTGDLARLHRRIDRAGGPVTSGARAAQAAIAVTAVVLAGALP